MVPPHPKRERSKGDAVSHLPFPPTPTGSSLCLQLHGLCLTP